MIDYTKIIYFVIDLETTGFSTERKRNIKSTCLEHINGSVIAGSQFQSLINPKQNVPVNVTKTTNINNAMIDNKLSFDVVGAD